MLRPNHTIGMDRAFNNIISPLKISPQYFNEEKRR